MKMTTVFRLALSLLGLADTLPAEAQMADREIAEPRVKPTTLARARRHDQQDVRSVVAGLQRQSRQALATVVTASPAEAALLSAPAAPRLTANLPHQLAERQLTPRQQQQARLAAGRRYPRLIALRF